MNITFSPSSSNCLRLPERKPSPRPTSNSREPTPQAMPNMVRNERSLCAHSVRRVWPKMSKINLTGERIPELERIAVDVLFTGSYFGKISNVGGREASHPADAHSSQKKTWFGHPGVTAGSLDSGAVCIRALARNDSSRPKRGRGRPRHKIFAMRGRAAEVGCPTHLCVEPQAFYRTSMSPEPLRRSRLKPPPPRTLPRTSCRFCVPSTVTGTPRLMELELECA